MSRPRVAAIITEYRYNAHADVAIGKLLEGYSLYGVQTEPRVEIVSMYLDQIPENDLGVAMAAKHGVPIFPSIAEAIAVGGTGVNVDGVIIIGEHGDYPWNELEQKLYPRRRFFEAAMATMVGAGKFVPVFNDKHLSYSYPNARWMYDSAQRLGIPFLAGSSLPVAWREPALWWPLGTEVDDALALGYGGVEVYGFHTLETLQCMVERRPGGETGVRRVQCLEGDAVWEAGAEGRWSQDLLDAALASSGGPTRAEVRETAPAPVAFLLDYNDGFQAAALIMDKAVSNFAFAARRGTEIDAAKFHLQKTGAHGHWTFLVRQMESLILNRKPPYPVERTLLTTGILDALMHSRHEDHRRVETPELNISYIMPEEIPDTGVGEKPPADD